MKPTLRVLAGLLAATLLFVVPVAATEAQGPGLVVDLTLAASADAVVNGSVTSTTVVQTQSVPYTVADVTVADVLSGTANTTIQVAVPGGVLADGGQVYVTHGASLHAGDEVQLALAPVAPHVQAAVAAAGRTTANLYSVNGGDEGAIAIGGSALAGANDYKLKGNPWQSFSPPATYRVNPNGSGLSAAATINAVDRAAASWENDPTTLIDFTNAGTTSIVGADTYDGVNVVSFQYFPNEGFLAVAHTLPNANGQFNFDIVFNTKHTLGDRSGSGAWFDIESTALHEFGHVLGLDHTTAASEVMAASIVSGTIKGLGLGDLNGVRQMYAMPAGDYCDGKLVTVNLATGSGSPTNGADVILGTDGNDSISGLGGDDVICGEGGDDILDGGHGADTIFGGAGNDYINGGDGKDTVNGNAGNDTLLGGSGGDYLAGAGGDDAVSGGSGWDTLRGNAGRDVLHGNSGNDNLNGGSGSDQVYGDGGLDVVSGGGGADTLYGGGGNDKVNGQGGNDLAYGGAGDDKMWGSGGDDNLNGGPGRDTIWGGWGYDRLNGGEHGDWLFGEGHADILWGAGGWDTLDGGYSTDTCDGGSGTDSASGCESTTSAP